MELKIVFFLIVVSVSNVLAIPAYSQVAKVSLDMENKSLEQVMDEIEKQSEFYFILNQKQIDVNRIVSIQDDNKLITDILPELFKGTNVNYVVLDRQILLTTDPLENNLLAIASGTDAQQKQITGTVTDNNGTPLPGVNVVVTGTTVGAITDINGKYSIEVPQGSKSLTFSFIGMEPQEVSIGTMTQIDVTMTESAIGLGEVVVIGYGTARKIDLTGSITAVKQDEYRNQPVNRVDQILQGRSAGVNIMNSSGAPGGTSIIRIRGANSITGNNDPLFVIDGLVGADFRDVNPSNIETIQVLKDASSTAIYGSRGANGVVLITTKSGVSGKPKFSFTSRFITSKVAKLSNIMDAGNFAQTVNDRADALGYAPRFTDAQVEDFIKNGGTDWQNEVVRTGNGQEHQLDYSGGTENVTYFISGNYFDQDGILINSYYNKYSIRSNIDAKISDKLKATLKASFTRRTNNNTSGNYNIYGPLSQSTIWSPTTPAYDEFGVLTVRDPICSINANPIELALNDAISENNAFNASGGFVYQIIEGLTLDLGFGASHSSTQRKNFRLNAQEKQSSASRASTEQIFLQSTNILTYTKTFNDIHKLSLTGGVEYQIQQRDYFSVDATALKFPELKYDNLTLCSTTIANASNTKSTIGSYVGRISYSLMDRYLVTGSVRNDRSSKFRGDNQKSTFPAIGLGWRISKEAFLRDIDFLDNLKLRASWGQTGSQAIDVYGTVSTYNTDAGNAGVAFENGLLTSGINLGNPGNTALKWETTTQSNVGFDIAVLKNRISLEADYFVKNTRDLLLLEPLPRYVGGGNIYKNIGEVMNSGFEFSLRGLILDNSNFSWDVGLNVSLVKENKVVSIGSREFITVKQGAGGGIVSFAETILMPGYSLFSYYGYKCLGIWQVNEATEAALYGNVPGDYKYEDLNGDYGITGADLQIIGSGIPTKIIGFNSTMSYKGFTLNTFFQSMLGFDKWNFVYAQSMTAMDAREYTNADIMTRWSPEHPDRMVAAFSPTRRPQIQSSLFVESGNFLRLKNISLQYNLPNNILKWADASIQISGQNIWTLTKYKGLDPEASSNVGDSDSRGPDAGAYPNSKSWTFGINLTF
ncbi:MAG TPA: TonB-dependent receptor [Bacteroidales bacterium]|nr:TonB-dependent receptor [Bacteroidales bacterium]